MEKTGENRREFMKEAGKGLAASSILAAGFPTIVPASVLGPNAPGNRINIGAKGARSATLCGAAAGSSRSAASLSSSHSKPISDCKSRYRFR